MRNTQHAGTRWFRLGVMAISIGLIGGLSGCEDDGSGSQPGDGSSHHGGSGRLAVDIFGNRGGVLTAVPSGLCLGEARVLWSNGVRGFSTDDSAPDQPLTASVSCGWVSASQTLVPQNVFSAPSVFAVLKADRTLAVWGSRRLGGDTSALPAQPQNVVAVAGNERAMAALQADGTVIGWGRAGSGASFAGPVGIGSADATSPVAPLGKVAKLWPTKRGFVALNSDGSASSWGNIETTFDGNGGSKSISSYFDAARLAAFKDVASVSHNLGAVALLKKDGSVLAFGDPNSGGDASPLAAKLNNVASIAATDYNFAALKKDGSVVVWGLNWDGQTSDYYDGSEPMPAGVSTVQTNLNVFAALKQDGSVATIGSAYFDRGADTSPVAANLTGVRKLYASKTAFAALRKDGSVVTWGDGARNDASGVQHQLNRVRSIAATELAFAALRQDGSVVTWGDELRGGDSSAVRHRLRDVVAVFANDYAFAALKADGSVVTWGAPTHGGDSSAVRSRLVNIRAIYSTPLGGFLAVAKDGKFVAWGSPSAGGSAPAGLAAIPYVKN